jgi:uncharacterized membrane protein YjjP (DUF1212 family)
MSLETHFRWLVGIGIVGIALSIASYMHGDKDALLIAVIAVAALAVAWWAKAGWDNRPRL